jgi:hypothetical protein
LAESTYIEEIKLRKSAIIAMTDDIIARMMVAKDLDGNDLLRYAGRMTFADADFNHPVPFALVRIIDPTSDKVTQNYSVVNEIVELAIVLVFSANGTSDVQEYGFALRDTVTDYLMDKTAGRPNGWDRPVPRWWGFKTDLNFKARLARSVTLLDGSQKRTSGSKFIIPVQFKVDVNVDRYPALNP